MSKGKLKVALKNQKIKEASEKSKSLKSKSSRSEPVVEETEEIVEEKQTPKAEEPAALTKAQKKKLRIQNKKARKAAEKEQSEKGEDEKLDAEEETEEKVEAEEVEAEAEADAEEDDDEEDENVDLDVLAASESESDIEDDDEEEEEDDDEEKDEEEEDEEEKDEEEEEDIPISDVELDSDTDVVPHSKLTINNTAALKDALARIQLPWEKHSFVEHQSVVSAEKTELGIKDIYDDTERELAFYKQGLDAVHQARATLLKLKVPFSRPLDYFAEMVKSDEHMDKLKTKLLKEAADKRASEDAKKQRQLKKFGKQVQHATLQDRAKQKRETLDKIKSLKKKRSANEISNDDEFQIALEEATQEQPKRQRVNGKRMAKDAKYGHGGKKRFLRKNDADSSADIYNQKGKKGKAARPGKSKRGRN